MSSTYDITYAPIEKRTTDLSRHEETSSALNLARMAVEDAEKDGWVDVEAQQRVFILEDEQRGQLANGGARRINLERQSAERRVDHALNLARHEEAQIATAARLLAAHQRLARVEQTIELKRAQEQALANVSVINGPWMVI